MERRLSIGGSGAQSNLSKNIFNTPGISRRPTTIKMN